MSASPSLPDAGRPAAIFFDLDGTLVDTAGDLGEAANAARAAAGLPPLPLADYRRVASSGARGLLGLALGIGPGHAEFPRYRDLLLTHYAAHIAVHSGLFAGMEESLAHFERAGVPWGVVTNKPKRYTDALLAALDLTRRCAAVVSADEVAQAKPAPDGLFLACERASVDAARCVYVGDDLRDIAAAHAAGMKSVAAGWGYEGEHAIASWGAELMLEHPGELRGLVPMMANAAS